MYYTRYSLEQRIREDTDRRPLLSSARFHRFNASEQPISYTYLNIHDVLAPSSDWSDLDLTNFHAENALLTKALFLRVNLSFACLHQAQLNEAQFTQALLYHALLTKVVAYSADFTLADITHTNMGAMVAPHACFKGCHTQLGANFAYAQLTRANFDEAQLICVDFTHANLARATFRGADLTGASFNYATLSKNTLEGAYLKETTLNHIRYHEEEPAL